MAEWEKCIGRGIRSPLHVASQISLGLEAAHEKGIVHRDLKPANIKITPEGKVKVLDFGLAKIFAEESEIDLANSPTILPGRSEPGVIMGTAAYMSPEQARGKHIDKRTDIWAFGCLLFEMLSGRQTFSGETASDAIARIIEREPDWPALPPSVPPGIRSVIQRCLRKGSSTPNRTIKGFSNKVKTH